MKLQTVIIFHIHNFKVLRFFFSQNQSYFVQKIDHEVPCVSTPQVCPGLNVTGSTPVCDDGMVWDGNSCINPHECPCLRGEIVHEVRVCAAYSNYLQAKRSKCKDSYVWDKKYEKLYAVIQSAASPFLWNFAPTRNNKNTVGSWTSGQWLKCCVCIA